MNGFAKLIYELRKEKGFTQAELGEKLGITDKAISRWENGDSYPETAQLIPLSALFNITIDELLKGERHNLLEEQEDEEIIVRQKQQHVKTSIPLSQGQTFQLLVALVLMFLGVLAIVVLHYFDFPPFVYMGAFFLLIALAVAILVCMGMNKLLNESKVPLDNESKAKQNIFQIAIGVAFFILTPVGFIAISQSQLWGACTAFVLFVAGLCLTVYGGIGWNREFNSKQPEFTYIPGKTDTPRRKTFKSRLIGAVMPLVTAAFLVMGFLFDMWHPGWIVFPLGGLLCGVLGILLGD